MRPRILFDLDGTLVDSRAVVERHWARFCERHGLDLGSVLAVAHGVRSVDVIAAVAPHLDAAAEARAFDASEELDTDGLAPVRGAHAVLAGLSAGDWGIVTSGHRSLARRRLEAVGLPLPPAMVCGDDVATGKPDPEGFLTGARLLGVAPEACVAVEDAPAGIVAARAAGMPVIAVTTTHRRESLTQANRVIADLTELTTVLAALVGSGEAPGPGQPSARRR